MELQEYRYRWGYKSTNGVKRVRMEFQELKWGYKSTNGVSRVQMGLQEYQWGYKSTNGNGLLLNTKYKYARISQHYANYVQNGT